MPRLFEVLINVFVVQSRKELFVMVVMMSESVMCFLLGKYLYFSTRFKASAPLFVSTAP